jgi:hypothetical protein
MASRQENGSGTGRRTAGAFDVRFIIGGLLAVYGLVLVIVAVVSSDGRSINLWSGVGMLATAVIFGLWARIRPIVIPEDFEAADKGAIH